jgi:flagellin-like protein
MKRAFSPVIAALILMLIAVAAGVVAYSYVMGWLGGATETDDGVKGQLQIDSIYATASTNNITVYVRNVGQKTLTLASFYVDGLLYVSPSDELGLGVVSSVIFTVDKTLTYGNFYVVRVTCTDGTTVSQSVEAK